VNEAVPATVRRLLLSAAARQSLAAELAAHATLVHSAGDI